MIGQAPLTIGGSPYFGRAALHLYDLRKRSLLDGQRCLSPYWVRRQDIPLIGWYGNRLSSAVVFVDTNLVVFNVSCLFEDGDLTQPVKLDQPLCERYSIPLDKWGRTLQPNRAFVEARAAMRADRQLSPYWLTEKDLELFTVNAVGADRVCGLINAAHTNNAANFNCRTCFWPMVLSLGALPLEFQPSELLRIRRQYDATCLVTEDQLRVVSQYSPEVLRRSQLVHDAFGRPHHLLLDKQICTSLFTPPVIDSRGNTSGNIAAELQLVAALNGYYLSQSVEWLSEATACTKGYALHRGEWTFLNGPKHVGRHAHISQLKKVEAIHKNGVTESVFEGSSSRLEEDILL